MKFDDKLKVNVENLVEVPFPNLPKVGDLVIWQDRDGVDIGIIFQCFSNDEIVAFFFREGIEQYFNHDKDEYGKLYRIYR